MCERTMKARKSIIAVNSNSKKGRKNAELTGFHSSLCTILLKLEKNILNKDRKETYIHNLPLFVCISQTDYIPTSSHSFCL